MRKIYYLLTLFAFLPMLAISQITVTVGAGAVTGTTGSNVGVIYRSSATSTFDFSHQYYLYTASELAAAGLMPGMTITSISWYKDNAFGTDPTNLQSIWNIYMKNSAVTPSTTWSSNNFATQSTGATLVYANAAQNIPATIGWVTLTLTTPFVYTGGSLEIGSQWDCSLHTTSGPTTGGFAWRRDNITNVTFGSSNSTATVTMALQTARPWLQLEASCPTSLPAPLTTDASICSGSTATLTADAGPGYSYNWYDAPAGTLLGTGSSFVTPVLGTTTTFYATTIVPGCAVESTETPATANVTAVNVQLDAINESCTGNSDGTFAINTVLCGVAPFQFSVDGGPFGPAPTNLTPGTYSVVVQDANLDVTSPIVLNIGTTSTAPPPAPVAVEEFIYACAGAPSIPVAVTPVSSTLTYTVNMADSWGDGWNGNLLNIYLNGVLSTTLGAGFTTGFSFVETFTVNPGDVITSTWTTGSFATECSFQVMDENMALVASGNSTTMINYTVPAAGPVSINWYDAPGGTLVGTGTSMEAVGSTVMPTSAVGTYEFYAYATNGCISTTGALVTVYVSDVNVTLASIDESCPGNNDGTFSINSVTCGTAPFSFSVDGGAFGPAPTNLAAGTYTVIVQDNLSLQSAPVTVVIGNTSTVNPPVPTAIESVIYACSGTPSIPVAVDPVGATLTYTVDMFDSFGDGWNGASLNVFLNGVLSATVGTGFVTGTNFSETFTVNEGDVITTTWNSGSYDSECSFDVLNETMSIIGSGTATAMINYSVPTSSPIAINWYDVPGGSVVGSGSTIESVGTTVMPASTPGTYEFYAYSDNGCLSTSGALVTVNIADVLVDITPVDESCINYSDGTFSISNVECGTAPFQFSVDGGAFGPAPTNLTAGTYSVVVQDNLSNESFPVDVVIGTVGTMIPNPPAVTDSNLYLCIGDPSALMVADGSTYSPTSLTTITTGGNGCGGGAMFNITTNTSDVVVTAIDAYTNSSTAQTVNVYYKVGTYVGSETVAANWTLLNTFNLTGVTGTALNLDITDLTIPAGSTYGIYVNYEAQYTTLATTYTAPEFTITTGAGLCSAFGGVNTGRTFNGTVHYIGIAPADVQWFDAMDPFTANQLGTGSPFEAVGTSVLPNTSTQGAYEFYAASYDNGCYSTSTTLVTVNVFPVDVEILAIDASCNGSATGSFAINSVACGTAPFSFSVNGGAFGPAPTDLVAGTYEIIVQDGNGDVSGTYYLVVGEAGTPSDLYMADITDNGGQVSWNANGTETQWNVEWGLPGFTPGAGQEIGSAVVSDTFAIITGLNSNEEYEIYVSANCGATTVNVGWVSILFTTDCGIYTLPFVETFEDSSETRICWLNNYEVGTADWTYNTGAGGGVVTTAFEGTKNARFVSMSGTNSPITKLVSPRFDFAGQDSVAMVFAYAQESWGTQNITKVYVKSELSAWSEIASYNTNVNTWTVDTLFVPDTTYQVAFEGINNWGRANVVDYVQFLPCNLNPGVDGEADVCRLDQTFDLNTIITPGEDFGTWVFPPNQTFVNGSIVDVALLPTGTYEFYYIVKTPCAADTTVATLNIFPPSSAGTDGVLSMCQNEPFNLLAGLGGLVDMGGTWYDPGNNALPSGSIVAEDIAGQYNYDYVVTNGVCPNDTSNVVVNVSPSCDYLDIQELYFSSMDIHPNPTVDVVFVTNDGSTEVFNYELLDTKGRVIRSVEKAINGTTETEISLKSLEPGVYMIRVHNDNAEKTFRIVKQ